MSDNMREKDNLIVWKMVFTVITIILTGIYLVWRAMYTFPTDHGVFSMICAVILFAAELMGLFDLAVHFYINVGDGGKVQRNKMLNQKNDANKMADYVDNAIKNHAKSGLPAVDVFVTTYNEEPSLLRRTLSACKSMRYDTEKLNIWLCDDASNPDMKALCDELEVGYIERESHESAKAGNLNHAMSVTKAPLIAIFDADMCPMEDFLLETVPYFIKENKKGNYEDIKSNMGFVQTPQAFRNDDLFQHSFNMSNRIPNEQDYFYRSIEPARMKNNSVVFGGSNTLLSRHALKESGGFAMDCITEDFATGIEIQKNGYDCVALTKTLARGLTPESPKALIRQRCRWARGCIQAGKKAKLIRDKRLSFTQKLCYLASISYWYAPVKRLIYILAPLMYALFGVTVIRCSFEQMVIFWLPAYLCQVFGIRLFSGNVRSAKWSNIYEICLFPYMLIPVILETIGIKERKFNVTDKSGKKSFNFIYTLPFCLLIGLHIYGIMNVVNMMINKNTVTYLFLLFWLVFNLYDLILALMFYIGCSVPGIKQDRQQEVKTLKRDIIAPFNLMYIIFSPRS